MPPPPPGPWFAEHTEFDEGNEGHFALHQVRADEIVSMLNREPVWRPNKKSGTGEWQVIGRTAAGRPLTVVVVWDEIRLSVRPITARTSTAGEVRRWL